MDRIEAVIFMGEPKRWESALQILVDVLRSDGVPNETPEAVSEEHLPLIACNMDLQFMDRASMPRYTIYIVHLHVYYEFMQAKFSPDSQSLWEKGKGISKV